MNKEQKQRKRAFLDQVYELAKSGEYPPYECAMWILYRLTKIDAIDIAREGLKQWEDEDLEDMKKHTVRDDLQDYLELVEEDSETAQAPIEEQMRLGKELDPDYDKPVLTAEEIAEILAKRSQD